MSNDIPMTKENKLSILKRAREIISDRSRWGEGRLKTKGVEKYCVLGACELAVYELGFAERTRESFGFGKEPPVDAYALGSELSLNDYARRVYETSPDGVNDFRGYETTMEMLDGYINEVTTKEA